MFIWSLNPATTKNLKVTVNNHEILSKDEARELCEQWSGNEALQFSDENLLLIKIALMMYLKKS